MNKRKGFVLPRATCNRCGHEWVPKIRRPKWCPGCNSPYWNTPRTRPATVQAIPRKPGAALLDVITIAAALGALTMAVRYVAVLPGKYLAGGLALIMLIFTAGVYLWTDCRLAREQRKHNRKGGA